MFSTVVLFQRFTRLFYVFYRSIVSASIILECVDADLFCVFYPATSFEKSQLQPLLPILEAFPMNSILLFHIFSITSSLHIMVAKCSLMKLIPERQLLSKLLLVMWCTLRVTLVLSLC